MQHSSHQLSIKLMQRCPSCHTGIQPAHINIIKETDEFIFGHVNCSSCQSNYLTYISSNPQGLFGNAMLTDLTYTEALRTLTSDYLSEDEFLRLYKLIADKNLLNSFNPSFNQSNKKKT